MTLYDFKLAEFIGRLTCLVNYVESHPSDKIEFCPAMPAVTITPWKQSWNNKDEQLCDICRVLMNVHRSECPCITHGCNKAISIAKSVIISYNSAYRKTSNKFPASGGKSP